MRTKYVKIRETLCARERESRRIHASLRAASGLARHELRLEKRRCGKETRHLLLAYAFLRGVPYAALEARCRTPPSATSIAELVTLYAPDAPCDADRVKRWLAPPAAPDAQAGAT